MEPITSFTGANRFLSNFYPCAVTLDFFTYTSVEHAYQAAKCANFQRSIRSQIRTCQTPGMAKRLGAKAILSPDWVTRKVKVMADLLEQKFAPDTDLAGRLLETGDRELIEGNLWGDVFWGVCNGIGENNLGKLLMERRKWLTTR